jgi:hypothetical protein
MNGGLASLGDGLSRVFLREVMRVRRMSTADLAAWLGCDEDEIWNLFARTDGEGS